MRRKAETPAVGGSKDHPPSDRPPHTTRKYLYGYDLDGERVILCGPCVAAIRQSIEMGFRKGTLSVAQATFSALCSMRDRACKECGATLLIPEEVE